MKKALSVLGMVFLLLLVVFGCLFGYAAYEGHGLDESSKQYVEENVPIILSTWSKQEVLKRASPQLLRAIDSQPGLIDKVLHKLSKLGTLKSFTDVKGTSQWFQSVNKGKTISASYTAKANFENGDADITIRLIRNSAGQWQLLLFNVNSPIMLE